MFDVGNVVEVHRGCMSEEDRRADPKTWIRTVVVELINDNPNVIGVATKDSRRDYWYVPISRCKPVFQSPLEEEIWKYLSRERHIYA